MKQYKIKDFTQHTDDPTSYDGDSGYQWKRIKGGHHP